MKYFEAYSTCAMFIFLMPFLIQLGCAYKLFSCDSVHDMELIVYLNDSSSKPNVKEILNKRH